MTSNLFHRLRHKSTLDESPSDSRDSAGLRLASSEDDEADAASARMEDVVRSSNIDKDASSNDETGRSVAVDQTQKPGTGRFFSSSRAAGRTNRRFFLSNGKNPRRQAQALALALTVSRDSMTMESTGESPDGCSTTGSPASPTRSPSATTPSKPRITALIQGFKLQVNEQLPNTNSEATTTTTSGSSAEPQTQGFLALDDNDEDEDLAPESENAGPVVDEQFFVPTTTTTGRTGSLQMEDLESVPSASSSERRDDNNSEHFVGVSQQVSQHNISVCYQDVAQLNVEELLLDGTFHLQEEEDENENEEELNGEWDGPIAPTSVEKEASIDEDRDDWNKVPNTEAAGKEGSADIATWTASFDMDSKPVATGSTNETEDVGEEWKEMAFPVGQEASTQEGGDQDGTWGALRRSDVDEKSSVSLQQTSMKHVPTGTYEESVQRGAAPFATTLDSHRSTIGPSVEARPSIDLLNNETEKYATFQWSKDIVEKNATATDFSADFPFNSDFTENEFPVLKIPAHDCLGMPDNAGVTPPATPLTADANVGSAPTSNRSTESHRSAPKLGRNKPSSHGSLQCPKTPDPNDAHQQRSSTAGTILGPTVLPTMELMENHIGKLDLMGDAEEEVKSQEENHKNDTGSTSNPDEDGDESSPISKRSQPEKSSGLLAFLPSMPTLS